MVLVFLAHFSFCFYAEFSNARVSLVLALTSRSISVCPRCVSSILVSLKMLIMPFRTKHNGSCAGCVSRRGVERSHRGRKSPVYVLNIASSLLVLGSLFNRCPYYLDATIKLNLFSPRFPRITERLTGLSSKEKMIFQTDLKYLQLLVCPSE